MHFICDTHHSYSLILYDDWLSFFPSVYPHLQNAKNKAYFLKFIFNWNTTALQCCVSFCSKTVWNSFTYTEIASLSHPSRSAQSTKLSSLRYKNIYATYLFYT